ncbi:MAG: outer membrane beta-barrel protein [Gemmatimonadetes bacterium]|nr:outer membrane beta-barrel protein [Gemmatimonadota bacterium]
MKKRTLFATAFLALAAAAPAMAQQSPMQRLSVEPYVGYGFFGSLPESNSRLEAGVAYGGRVAFQLSPQWAAFGNAQRSQVEQRTETAGVDVGRGDVNVDHWAAGVEFSYAPRGGAEGMLPIVLEAGLGQARYDLAGSAAESDLAVKIGASSALRLSPNLAIRYGVDDYISNFRGDQGVVNQIFARVGAELRF